jgi:predicted TIM-barrel enzyme
MQGNKIDVAQSRKLAGDILASNGKFVTVTFLKKDGTIRKMNCRMGVTKHLKGGESTLDADQYVTVFDMAKGAYRAINRDTIIEIKGVDQPC